MSQIAIIYWSGTGNTKEMAQAIYEGIKKTDACDLFEVSEISSESIANYDKVVLGCPSMGDEILEEYDFQPFYDAIKPLLSGKKVGLFGSYGWGDGAWMRDWESDVEETNALLIAPGLIINESPDASGIQECEDFADKIVSA